MTIGEKQMFTVDYFMKLAETANTKYEERVAMGFGPGTVDDERNDARKMFEQAIAAADYMEKNEIESAKAVGSFCNILLKKGDKVRLKAGAKYRWRGIWKVNQRNRTITIQYMSEGYTPYCYSEYGVRNPSVTWAGTGGYWCDVDINEIELI